MIEANDISVRVAGKADTIAIANLLRSLGLSMPSANEEEKVLAQWERLWDQNPAYTELPEPVVYGWVMEHQQQVVGFFGYFPRIYYLNKQKLSIMVATSWGVLKPYRLFISLLCDAFFQSYPGRVKLGTTAIVPTGRIFERYGAKRFPAPELNHTFLIPFRLEKLARLQFASRPWLYKLVNPFLHAGNYLLPSFFQCKWLWNKQGLTEIGVHELPADFEIFWQTYLQRTPQMVASRSIATMQWVYADVQNLNRKRLFLYRSPGNQELLGYASLVLETIPKAPDIKRYKIGDLVFLNEEVKQQLIRGLIAYARMDGADLLEFHLVSSVQRRDIPTFALKRTTASFPVYYHIEDQEVDHFLSNRNNWMFTPYDGDTILG